MRFHIPLLTAAVVSNRYFCEYFLSPVAATVMAIVSTAVATIPHARILLLATLTILSPMGFLPSLPTKP